MTGTYHEGELEVQARAGVREAATRIGHSIRSEMPQAAQEFLSSQPFGVIASIDVNSKVWASLVSGKPGFMRAVDGRTVQIDFAPASEELLAENLAANNQIGLIAIEFATRRRMRINGTAQITDAAIIIQTEQVYSNCPKYIQARTWHFESQHEAVETVRVRSLNEKQRALIESADTFFIASHHKEGGADASHRGGTPGFVRFLDGETLVFPDYSGNMMFQTLGNIQSNPHCGLLFIDFQAGKTLQLTGAAETIWETDKTPDFAGAERVVKFSITEAIEKTSLPLNWQFVDYSPFNPA